ncbi:MAG: hypothetical protein AAGK37_12345 [Pseudomonadota bacterium]
MEFRIAELRVTPASRRLLGPSDEVTISPRAMAVLVRLARAGT